MTVNRLIVSGTERNGWISSNWQQTEKSQWRKHLFVLHHRIACHVPYHPSWCFCGTMCKYRQVSPAQSSKEEVAYPMGWADLSVYVWISVMSENLLQSVYRNKNYLEGKEKELSRLNRVRGQYAEVPLPEVAFAHYHSTQMCQGVTNNNLSILSAIGTDKFIWVCSFLLAGLHCISCGSSRPTPMFRRCPVSAFPSAGTVDFGWAARSCSLILRDTSPCFLTDPSAFASQLWGQTLCLKTSLSCWST